jgi:hypothetical protein
LFGEANGSSKLSVETEMQGFKPFRLTDYYLSRTLTLLEQRGVNVLYLTPPLNLSKFDHIKLNVASEFGDYLQAKARTLNHFHVAENVITCWPDEDFGDDAHRNELGAAR